MKQTQSLLRVLLLMNTIPAAHIRAPGPHLRGVWMYSISGKTDYGSVTEWPHRVPEETVSRQTLMDCGDFSFHWLAEGHIQWCMVRSWLMPWIIRSLWLSFFGVGSPTLRGSFVYNTLMYPGSIPVKLTHSFLICLSSYSLQRLLGYNWRLWWVFWPCGKHVSTTSAFPLSQPMLNSQLWGAKSPWLKPAYFPAVNASIVASFELLLRTADCRAGKGCSEAQCSSMHSSHKYSAYKQLKTLIIGKRSKI